MRYQSEGASTIRTPAKGCPDFYFTMHFPPASEALTGTL